MKNLVKEAVEAKIEDLKADPQNENKHSDEQIAVIAKRIREAGFYNPIIADSKTKLIVAGHGRWEAAKLLNLGTVPVIFKTYKSKKERDQDRIADNMTARESELSTMMITDVILQYDDGTMSAADWGMAKETLDEIMLNAPPEEDKESDVVKESTICPKCGHEF